MTRRTLVQDADPGVNVLVHRDGDGESLELCLGRHYGIVIQTNNRFELATHKDVDKLIHDLKVLKREMTEEGGF